MTKHEYYPPSKSYEDKCNWLRRSHEFNAWRYNGDRSLKHELLSGLANPLFCVYNGARALFEEFWCPYKCKWCGSQYHSVEEMNACKVNRCDEKKKLYGENPLLVSRHYGGGFNDSVSSGFDGGGKYYYDGVSKYHAD